MIELRGRGLFGGRPATVQLHPSEGEVTVQVQGERVPLASCFARPGALCTELELPGGSILRSVEHWAAAAAGLSLHTGHALRVIEGDELPLLDSAASAWCSALARLAVAPTPPRLRVVRPFVFETDEARYELLPAASPELHVELVTHHSDLTRHAAWSGDREIFEREYLLAQIARFSGNISRTAEFIGMERSALHRKLKSLGIGA